MNGKQMCRCCGRTEVCVFLSLGKTPLANALLRESQLATEEESYPLEVGFCRYCALVQITETVPPEKLFRDYVYLSSFSDTMLHHVSELVERLIADRCLGRNNLVVEIGSNDGYLLQYYKASGIPVLGIDPAVNVARIAQETRGIRTLAEFFSEALALRLRREGLQADVIHLHNVLAHVPDLNGVVEGIRILLQDRGIAVIEVPYVRDLIEHTEFDTIYHEHLCYFSLVALREIFERHGLKMIEAEHLPIHGGSVRLHVAKGNAPGESHSSRSLLRMIEQELSEGVDRIEYYQHFAERVSALRTGLIDLLRRLKAENKRIAAYGASAKGSTLLNYLGTGRELVEYVVDRNTIKQGLFTPGQHLPIHAPSKLIEDRPDYVLLLTWNWAGEIMAQQAEYQRGGGRFIIPIPELRIV
jgi:SAM-dependent methyltransferase